MKKERLQKAVSYLRYNNIITKNKDIADKMGADESNVSRSLSHNSNEKSLTDSFLRRFNAAFGGIFNIDWLLTGEGEMLSRPEESADTSEDSYTVIRQMLKEIEEQRKVTIKAQEQIDALLQQQQILIEAITKK